MTPFTAFSLKRERGGGSGGDREREREDLILLATGCWNLAKFARFLAPQHAPMDWEFKCNCPAAVSRIEAEMLTLCRAKEQRTTNLSLFFRCHHSCWR